MARFFVGILLAACLFIALSSETAAYPRRRGYRSGYASTARQRFISAAKAELAAGQDLLAAANGKGAKAAVEITTALGKLQDAKRELDAAEGEIKDLARHLREIEQEILNDQKEDSAYKKAKALADERKSELAALEKKLLADGRYEERKADANGDAKTVLKLREELLTNNLEYRAIKDKADAAAKELNRVREDLFRADKDWKEISDALADAHREEDSAQDKANSAGVSRLGPLKDSRDAAQVAAFAKAHIANAQSVLARLGVKANNNARTKSKSSSPGKQG